MSIFGTRKLVSPVVAVRIYDKKLCLSNVKY